jgi:hypothetical protein
MADTADEKMKTLSKLRRTAKQATVELPPAFISAWFYTFVGILCGVLLLAAQKGLEIWSENVKTEHTTLAGLPQFFAFIFEHLGIGFIVAAIAVFFYEWGAHIKKTMSVGSRLAASISQIEDTKKLINRNDELTAALAQTEQVMEALELTGRLYRDISIAAKHNLKWSLNDLFIGPSTKIQEYVNRPEYLITLEEAVNEVEQLAVCLSKLRKDNAWGNDKYIKFITEHINEVVGHNARAFSALIRGAGKQEFTVPPTAAGMAAQILAKQMEAMKEGDSYDVISDLTSWQDTQLDKLFEKTGEAVRENDIKVRRVFNLIPYIRRGRDNPLPHNYLNILTNHLRASEMWKGKNGKGNYEIKILWPKDYDENLKNNPSLKGTDVASLHFGLFIHGDQCVKFQVTKTDLSDMELCRQAYENNDSRLFGVIWMAASEFPIGESTGERASLVMNEIERLRGRE